MTTIKDLLNLDEISHEYCIDGEYQIIKITHVKTTKIAKGDLYAMTLADPFHSYDHFMHVKPRDFPKYGKGSYLKVKILSPLLLGQKKERTFLIKEMEVINDDPLNLYDSPLIKDDKMISKKIDRELIASDYVNESRNNNSKPNIQFNPLNDDYPLSNKYRPLNSFTSYDKDPLILIKCVNKDEMKLFKNGKGKYFGFIMMDELTNKMDAICFDKIADKFFGIIKEGNIYEIKGGYLKSNDKKYSTTNSNFKLILSESTEIILKSNNDFSCVSEVFFDFKTLKDVKLFPVNSHVDVICILIDKGDIEKKETKFGSVQIRKSLVFDDTFTKMELTLWKSFSNLQLNEGDVLVIQKIKVNDFGGKNITTVPETSIKVNPDDCKNMEVVRRIGELGEFGKKYELWRGLNSKLFSEDSTSIYQNLRQKSLSNSNISPLNTKIYDDKIIYIQSVNKEMDKFLPININYRFPFYKVKASILFLTHTEKNYYPGCSNKDCSKKVTLVNNFWICEKCHCSFKEPNYCYSLNIKIKDCSGECWVDIFGKAAEMLMGMKAMEYRKFIVERDYTRLMELSNKIEFHEFYFLLKVKGEEFKQQIKKKYTANKIEKINEKEEALRLMDELLVIKDIKREKE